MGCLCCLAFLLTRASFFAFLQNLEVKKKFKSCGRGLSLWGCHMC